MTNNTKTKGMLLAAFGGGLWGFSGVMAQLILDYGISAEWLVSCRMMLGGLCILVYSWLKHDDVLAVFRNKFAITRLVCFAFLGMGFVQYTFFKTIECSTASLATIIQFTAPVMLYVYELIRGYKQLRLLDLSLILAAIFGVVLLVTDGHFSRLNVSSTALFFGLACALGVVLYTLLPQPLIVRYGAAPVVGFGMLIAGAAFQFVSPLYSLNVPLDGKLFAYLFVTITFGTAVAFLAYLQSTMYIPSSMASLFTALEPLLVSVFSIFIFGKCFTVAEITGIVIIIAAILLFSKVSQGQSKVATSNAEPAKTAQNAEPAKTAQNAEPAKTASKD